MKQAELEALSRAYRQHKDEIQAEIVRQLRLKRPQCSIAAAFGIGYWTVYRIARDNGIRYINRKPSE